MRRSICHVAFALSLSALLLAGCEDVMNTPTAPTDPVLVTSSFTGTLTASGGVTFPFGVASSGSVAATLTTVSESTLVVGISLGKWNGSSCTVVVSRDAGVQGDAVAGTSGSFGSLCVRIYDVGNVVDPVTFEITVIHP
jgi:hypothetical protein